MTYPISKKKKNTCDKSVEGTIIYTDTTDVVIVN